MTLPYNSLAENELRRELRLKKALVIDDFQGMRTLMQHILESLGVREINTAPGAAQALEQLRWKNYDIILCDYNLGPGKNGQHLLEEARVNALIRPTAVWLMVTAEKTLDMVLGAIEYAPDDYLIKPIQNGLLRERLGKALARKKALAPIFRAQQAGQYAAALALCDRLIEKRLYLTELYRLKGTICLQAEDYAAAGQVFESILAARNLPWARTGLGRVQALTGNRAQAITLFQEVIAENPTYLEAYDRLAEAYQAEQKLEEAQGILLRAIDLSPCSIARHKALGRIASARQDFPVAEKAFRQAIELGRHSVQNAPDAYIGLAGIYKAMGDLRQARETLAAARQLFSELHQRAELDAAAAQLQ